MPHPVLARAAADAPTISIPSLGVTIRTLVASAESGGALAALEYTAPPRFLVLATPGAGLEGYFGELARLIAESPVWPPADREAVAAIAARFDTFGPPVAAD